MARVSLFEDAESTTVPFVFRGPKEITTSKAHGLQYGQLLSNKSGGEKKQVWS